MKIAEKIFNYRKEHGITQAAFGEMLGVSDKVVSKWETEESLPATEYLPIIADRLGLSIDELFDRKIKTETGRDTPAIIFSNIPILPKMTIFPIVYCLFFRKTRINSKQKVFLQKAGNWGIILV